MAGYCTIGRANISCGKKRVRSRAGKIEPSHWLPFVSPIFMLKAGEIDSVFDFWLRVNRLGANRLGG